MMKDGKDRNMMTSRECRIPAAASSMTGGGEGEKDQPQQIFPVDTTLYNDDGDCVPEGIILNRIKG